MFIYCTKAAIFLPHSSVSLFSFFSWHFSYLCSLSIIPTSLSQLNKVVPHSLYLDPLFLSLSFSLSVSCGGNSAGFSFVLDLTMWLHTRTNTWFCQAPWKVLQHLQHGKQQETTFVCVCVQVNVFLFFFVIIRMDVQLRMCVLSPL